MPVTASTANWAPLVWVGVIGFAAAVYMIHGRRVYTPPVAFVEGRKQAGVGLQTVGESVTVIDSATSSV